MLLKIKTFIFIILLSGSLFAQEEAQNKDIIGIMSLDFADYVIQKHIVLSYEAFFDNNRFSLNPEFSISTKKAPYLSSNGSFENSSPGKIIPISLIKCFGKMYNFEIPSLT